MRRVIMAAAALCLSAAVTASVATPAAHAQNGGPGSGGGPGGSSVTCADGSSCQVAMSHMIHLNGDVSSVPNASVPVTPPPCLWIPKGDAITGSDYIIGIWGTDPSKAPTTFDIRNSVIQANALLKNPVPGTWYWLPVNPNATQQGQQECLKLPAYYWAVPGTYPPINIPPKVLAQFAFSRLRKATLASITINPPKVSDVNLPTYVSVHVVSATAKVWNNRLFIAVTASVPGEPSVTVWALSSPLGLSSGAPQSRTYNNCSARGAVGGIVLGTTATPGQMASAGPGQAIDCGVTYLTPSTPTFTLSASVSWQACWAVTGGITVAPNQPPGACQQVAGTLTPSTVTRQVTVQEVQSSNGG